MHTPNFLSYPADSDSSVNLFRDYFKIYFVLNVIQFRDANGQFFRFAIIHYG